MGVGSRWGLLRWGKLFDRSNHSCGAGSTNQLLALC